MLLAALLLAQAATDDVVVMRRAIARPAPRPAPTSSPTPPATPTPTGPVAGAAWDEGIWTVDPACGPTVERRTPRCMLNGAQVPASACAQAAPAAIQPAVDHSTCTYRWTRGDWTDYSADCRLPSVRTRPVACRRSDGEDVEDATCLQRLADPRPDSYEETQTLHGCTWDWKPSGYGAWLSTCSDAARRPIEFRCQRSDGVDDPGKCQGSAPVQFDTGPNYAGCTDPIVGGDFDVASSRWTRDPWSTHVTTADGRKVLQIATPNSTEATGAYQISGDFAAGATYRVTAEVRRTTPACGRVLLRAQPSGGAQVETAIACTAADWTPISLEVVAPANKVVSVYIYSHRGSGATHTSQWDNLKAVRIR